MTEPTLLGDVARVFDCEHRTAPPTDEVQPYAYSVGTRAVRNGILQLERAKPVSRETYESWTRRATPQVGDLIFSREAPMGEVGAVPKGARLCLGQRTVLVRPSPGLADSRFLRLALMAPGTQRWIEGMAIGSTVRHLNVADVKRIPLPALPALSDQRRIVDILEDHLSRLDAANDYLDANARRLRSLEEQVVLSRLVPHTASKAAAQIAAGQLPSLPTGWNWTGLGDTAAVVGGVTKDAKKQSDPAYVEVPYLRVANVQRTRLDLRDVATIRVRPAQAEALRLLPGDVLLNEGGDRDKLARGWIWSGEIADCIHQNHVFRARPNAERVRPEWLAWCANTYGSHWAQRHGRQSVNLASISLKTLSTMPVPIAPLAVQDRLLEEIRAFREGQEVLADSVGTARRQSSVLRQALLGAAFAGQLSGRATDLDNAEELAFS